MNAGLIRDRQGNLYGTNYLGGVTNADTECGILGCGTVFKVDPHGKESTLYSFTGGTDGGSPLAGVIQDEAGNLYGTTQAGGAYGWGVIFKLDPNGKETVLYNFNQGADGYYPEGSLVLDQKGNLYGATYFGGDVTGTSPVCGTFGCGVVFRLSTHEECKDGRTNEIPSPQN